MEQLTVWYARSLRLYFLNSPILYGFIFALFFVKSFFTLDPDFGWHLASGQYIVHHGIPSHDIYSYTMPNFPWIHHEWLADIGNYLVYHYLGGYAALSVLYAAMWTAAVWIITRRTQHRLLILLAVTLLLPFAGIRAITWTALLSSVLIALNQSKHRKALYLAPLVMLLWANVHGSFVVGIAYLLWQLAINRNRSMALIFIISLLTTLITPYGGGMYTEVLRTMTDSSLHTNISEWQPLQLSIGAGIFTGIWAAVLIVGEKGVWWKKFIRFESLLLVMALLSSRHTVLFILFALPTVQSGLSNLPEPKKTPAFKRLVVGLIMLLVCVCGLFIFKTFVGYTVNREATYPSDIAASLRAEPCSGNVFAHYNYGGYLIWKVPGEKLYIDGRMPSWTQNGQNIMASYIKVTKDASYRAREFSQYNVRCVIWDQRRDNFTKILQREGWSISKTEKNNSIVLLSR
jgi:hypothetical protein